MNTVIVQTSKGAASILRYESMGEAIREVENSPHCDDRKGKSSGFEGRSWEKTKLAHACGDKNAAARVSKILDKVDASFEDRESVKWIPGMVGAFPSVGDFLAGDPECMRLKTRVEDDRSPIRIFVGICVSAGVSIEIAEKRGAAAAALAMRLSDDRPVEIWTFADMKINSTTGLICVPVATGPISATEIAFTIGSIEALRRVAFGCLQHLTKSGGGFIQWAWGGTPTGDDYLKALKEALGATPEDIVLPGGYLTEVNRMANDPVKWVHDKLAQQRHVDRD